MTMPVSRKKFDGGHIPGPIIIPNCIQVRVLMTLSSGKAVVNVLHAQVAGTFSATTTIANNLMTGLASALTSSNLAANMPTTTSVTAVDLRDLRSPGNFPLVPSTVAAASGTSASPSMPPGTTLVITLRTAQAGRAFRGRVYWGGWATNADAGNGSATTTPSTGATVSLNAFFASWNTTWTSNGMTFCIGQPQRQQYTGITGTVHPARAANTIPLTAFQVRDAVWDSQRRRAQVA